MRRYSLRCRAFSLSLFLLVGCGSFGTASAQLINNDVAKNALLTARYAAMEAALAETLQAAREEEENATTEMQKADELLKQTLGLFAHEERRNGGRVLFHSIVEQCQGRRDKHQELGYIM